LNTKNEQNLITQKIIGSAIEVHRNMGPGLFESVYEECLCYEFDCQKINYERQKFIPIVYKGKIFNSGFRADLLVEQRIVVELKSVGTLLPIHESQIINYLKLSKLQVGLLIEHFAN
jgi:GxxExxY protein